MPDTTTAPVGTDAELDGLLTDVYTCTRVWSAWQYGTMTEDDFIPAAQDPDILADLTAWRDAAIPAVTESQRWQVEEARRRLSMRDAKQGDWRVNYNRERVLADQVRVLLAIVDQIAPAAEEG